MKLRVQGNTLRLRLASSEVRRLGENGVLEDRLSFGAAGSLSYRLELAPTATALAARYRAGEIVVLLPEADAREWIESARVGLAGEQSLGDGQVLRLLVEKDLARG